MTLHLSGYYPVGGNYPLNHARILWNPVGAPSTPTGNGTNPEYAHNNEFTFQRWALASGDNTWTLELVSNQPVDTIVIAAHTLAGKSVSVRTSDTTGGSFVTRADLVPADNSAIAVMFTETNGAPCSVRRVRIFVGDGGGCTVGIIRAGVSLQMERPVYGGVLPIGLNRSVETRHTMSETGQWLGRTIQRQALRTTMDWSNLTAAWYRAYFQPFALALPQTPFALIQNPARMPESVAWAWTEETPSPENQGVRDLMRVSLNITGFLA